MHALTRTYALEGARYGVYCNAVAPSVVEGAMAAQLSERQREQLARANPLRRLARMPEVVDAVRYLASDDRQLHQRRDPAGQRRLVSVLMSTLSSAQKTAACICLRSPL